MLLSHWGVGPASGEDDRQLTPGRLTITCKPGHADLGLNGAVYLQLHLFVITPLFIFVEPSGKKKRHIAGSTL